MAKQFKASRYLHQKPATIFWIYRHPQTGKLTVSCEPLNSDAVHRMGVNLIAAQAVGV